VGSNRYLPSPSSIPPSPPLSTPLLKDPTLLSLRGGGRCCRGGSPLSYPIADRSLARAENVATDLESFAHHAGRSTIQTDDVLLISRRNPQLQDMMQDFVDKEAVRAERVKRRKGKEVVKPRGRPKGVGKN
jgi:ribosomal protein L21